ncbi:porin family protein [Ferruginibacter profundus]
MKLFATIFATLLIINVTKAQVRVAAKAGWNYSTATAMYSGVKQPTDFTFGFGAGVYAKVPFEGVLNFAPSVMVNKRGFIVKPLTGTNKTEQYSITYLDIIPSFSFDFPHKSNSFAFAIGPDFGFTNFGKLKATNNNNVTTTEKLKFGYGQFGWFDLGLNASVSYHMKKIFVEAGYLHGLASINNNEEIDQRNIRNRMISLNLGFYIR